MTTFTNDTDPPHIYWLVIVRLLRALGPEKGSQVLVGVTDLLTNAEVWPHVTESLVDSLSQAFSCSVDLKVEDTDEILNSLKRAYAQEHIIEMIRGLEKREDVPSIQVEINRLKKGDFLPPEFQMLPVDLKALREALEDAKELDEYGATKDCECEGCKYVRAHAKKVREEGFDIDIH